MREQIRQYLTMLYQDIPNGVYEGLVSLLCIGAAFIFAFIGWKRGWRKVAGLLLFEIIFLIYSSTVLFRTTAETRGHDFMPFWSYMEIRDGRAELLVENVMNVVVFIPIGILLGGMVQGARFTVKKELLIALMVGMGISLSIEAMQYFFHRGFSETDDVIHNTLGCMIGYILVKGLQFLVKGYRR